MQFVVKDIADGQTALLDNALRMVSQLLTAWRNAAGDNKSVFVGTKWASMIDKVDYGN